MPFETGKVKNRRGILLGNLATPQTKTLTPTMWSPPIFLWQQLHSPLVTESALALEAERFFCTYHRNWRNKWRIRERLGAQFTTRGKLISTQVT